MMSEGYPICACLKIARLVCEDYPIDVTCFAIGVWELIIFLCVANIRILYEIIQHVRGAYTRYVRAWRTYASCILGGIIPTPGQVRQPPCISFSLGRGLEARGEGLFTRRLTKLSKPSATHFGTHCLRGCSVHCELLCMPSGRGSCRVHPRDGDEVKARRIDGV